MAKANALRVSDVRAAFRLIGDCRDQGDDPSAWQETALAGLCRLAGAMAGAGGEGRWLGASRLLQPISNHVVGLGETARAHQAVYMREYGVNADPIFQGIQKLPRGTVTRRRAELVRDGDWYRSAAFTDYRRPCGADHQLTSLSTYAATGETSCLSLVRALGERDFSKRECALVWFFHVELGRLIGGSLASAVPGDAARLAPRLRETLKCLLEGDSEKQAALRMGISQVTIHQYVTMLYRRFGVHSRAELLIRVLRRQNLRSRFCVGISRNDPALEQLQDSEGPQTEGFNGEGRHAPHRRRSPRVPGDW
jgi:DNA-binding CsgD family transcriptional regulator